MNKLAKRSLSFVTAMFLSIMSMVSGISESLAANPIKNISGTNEIDDVTLLVGENGMKGNTIAETIKNYDRTYALGIASQFCAFIEGDYMPSDSDTEGRLAVGGSLKPTCDWNYEIGNGDFEYTQYLGQYDDQYVRLGLDVLLDNSNYATFIVNGDTADKFRLDSDDNYIQLDGQKGTTKKRFVVGNNTEIGSTKGNVSLNDVIYRSDDILNVKAYFTTIKERSAKLAGKKDSGDISYTDGGKTLNLTCKDAVAGDTVYFNLDSWDENVNSINIDVQNGVYVVINCNDENIKISSAYTYNQFRTVYAGKRIDKGSDADRNNDPDSAYILYNFPQATTVELAMCFNGTILAPDAKFTGVKDSNGHNPHLSGSIIAKEFEGCAEMGFRPFTGPISMLGTVAGYALAVSKVDGNGNNLAGATIGLVLSDDQTGEVVSDIETINSEYNFVTIPTDVELTGNADIDAENYLHEKTYTLKEISAPAGYDLTEKEYKIKITEEVRSAVQINDNTFPTEIDVKVERDGKLIRHLTYKDSYDKDGNQTSRIIEIFFVESEDVFPNIVYNLSVKDGKVTDIKYSENYHATTGNTPDYERTLTFDTNNSSTFLLGNDTYYYDADNIMITRLPSEIPKFVNEAIQIQLTKVDGDTWQAITEDSAELEVYRARDDKLIASGTTKNGILDIGHLDPDRYYIKEKTAPKDYEPLSDILYFNINDDYSVTRDEDDSYEVSYTLNYADNKKVEGTAKAGKDGTFKINDILVKTEGSKLTISGSEMVTKDDDPAKSYSDFANLPISKIIVTGSSGVNLQVKTDDWRWIGRDEGKDSLVFTSDNNMTVDVAGLSNAKFDSNGNIKFAVWDGTVDSITIDCSETVASDDILESITITLKDGVKADSFTLNDGTEYSSETSTIEVGKALEDYPILVMKNIRNTAPNVEINDEKNPINIKVPNCKATETTTTTTTSTSSTTTTTTTTTSTSSTTTTMPES
ncbi:MAG: choice-of-anchor A family protein [Ruminococcus sp.]|nr:choice-of-anchor A family protein [Ruminococcus sp.]